MGGPARSTCGAGTEGFLNLVGGAEANQQAPGAEQATIITMAVALHLLLRSFLYFQPTSGTSILSANLSLKCKLQAKKMPHLPRPRWGISFCTQKDLPHPLAHF